MTPADSEIEYAYWTSPAGFTVTYPLGVFHEIDFEVNEGFRAIPHGGIERGGLLFGYVEEQTVRIEAFRQIACEHASGPSFVLSARDLSGLRQQIIEAGSDPELAGQAVVGWFVAHTRNPLRLSEREIALFDELFPEPGRLTVLVKPERFKPTQFGFLLRDANGYMESDAGPSAVILPLPGRAGKVATSSPAPSIPAPAPKPVLASPPPAAAPPVEERVEPIAAAAAIKPLINPPIEEVIEPPIKPAVEQAIELPRPRRRRPVTPMHDQTLLRIPDLPIEEIRQGPPAALPSIDEIRSRRGRPPTANDPPQMDWQQVTRAMKKQTPSRWGLLLLLLVAAALGCAVGYVAYLQLPPATVALTVRRVTPDLVVSWPPDQTRDASYAAIRINNGDEIPLSTAQKMSGEAFVPAQADNIKIELTVQHWMRDSRGIVRYVRPVATIIR